MRTVHQIVVGAADYELFEYPDRPHQLWAETDLEKLTWTQPQERIYRAYLKHGDYQGAANIARALILLTHGGVYVDADILPLQPLGEWADQGTWCATLNTGTPDTSVIGCDPDDPAIVEWWTRLGQLTIKATTGVPAWETTGLALWQPTALTHHVRLVPNHFFEGAHPVYGSHQRRGNGKV